MQLEAREGGQKGLGTAGGQPARSVPKVTELIGGEMDLNSGRLILST